MIFRLSSTCRYLSLCISAITAASFAYGSVTIQFAFGALRDSSGDLVPPGSLWALVVASPGSPLPGGLEKDSSLSASDILLVRTDFGGVTISSGSTIGDAVVMATGQVSDQSDSEGVITWTDEDYETIQAGGLIGLYWFPGIDAEATVLPASDFAIGGLQESDPDPNSDGNGGMIVPTNSGLNLRITYFDTEFTESPSSLPISRFTAIEVPPSGYQIWRDSFFTQIQIDAGEAAPDADPDGDGLANLLEYAAGHPPLLSSAAPLTLTRADASSVLLEFNRIADPELRYRVETTDNLGLSPWPGLVFESSGAENLEELVELSQPLSSGKRFFRLRVDFVP